MFDSMPSAMPFIESGKLRAVPVTTPQRVDELANIPTMAESGFPGFDISTWYGLWAPAGTPPEIVAKLSQHAARALKQPGLVSQYASLGAKRSEEHTSELQSLMRNSYAVFCLKKKNNIQK